MPDGTMPERMEAVEVSMDAILQTDKDRYDFMVAGAMHDIESAIQIASHEQEVVVWLKKARTILEHAFKFDVREREEAKKNLVAQAVRTSEASDTGRNVVPTRGNKNEGG